MSYEYIKHAYGVNPVVGERVRMQGLAGRSGTIRPEKPSNGHYVMVLFDGGKFSLPCHPTEIDYLGKGD